MNLFVLALALIANSCVAFVPPVVLVQLSSPSFNSHLDFRKTAKEATVEMNMVKAAKEATAEMMRKPQVVAEIMERAGLNKTQAEAALVAFTETVVDCVSDGKKINLQGFGTFESRERSGRQGRNPRTGEPIEIKATTVPAFSASKAFKEQVKAKSTS